MKLTSIVLSIILVYAIVGLETVDCNRRDVLKAFLPLKTTGGKQQRKLLSGGSELIVSVQSELILAQEQYIQQTIEEEANILDSLAVISNTACASYVQTGTDALMTLAGIAFGNCVAKIDDEMFAGLFPAQDSADRQAYAQASLLSSIRGVNILTDPGTVQARMESKLSAPVVIEGLGAIGDLSADLRAALQDCLSNARALLKSSLQTASTQVNDICAK
ncbi:AGAP007747-PA-like protein [Anopheles sinensis]|uniref:AGAP007747-PA-like protein n=1 Tax=Anopheles sinensis TaxID=74873 RepID=A0A084VFH3_ANOSI|nr:AGAP007747-PA-like protein [Anopheles sinensis]